jgi:outer membrane protein TolC
VWETRLIAIEAQLEEAESSLQEAASTLALTVGVNHSGYVLQVADIDEAAPDEEIPSTAMLHNVAMKQGYSESAVWPKLAAEKKRLGGKPEFAVAPLSAGYAHVSDHAGSKLGVGPNGFLLGGHTGTIDLGVKLSLWRTGESEALASLVAARIRSIELELLSVGDSVQRELEVLRQLVVSSRRKVELAARRLKLSTEVSRIVSHREKAGLESAESLLNAEADLVRSRAQFQQAQLESRTRWLNLLAACGRGDKNGARKLLLGQANPSGHEVGADQ